MSPRAVDVLKAVDLIAAEDTRHSGVLLRHFGVSTPLQPLHEHNERQVSAGILRRLTAGSNIAVISDAGTPLISDPGFHLVREARAAGIAVKAIPGPSAVVAALSISGLPTDRFIFEGFLPAKGGGRRSRLEALAGENRTLVFYESPHRILDSLEDMAAVFGPEREAILARELTKTYETVLHGSLGTLLSAVRSDADQRRGEMVIVVAGEEERQGEEIDSEARRVVEILLESLPVKQAAALAARITGRKKNALYRYALDRAAGRGSGED